MPSVVFIDGNDYRRAELAQMFGDVEVKLEALTAGFATAAPEPALKARDKVAAHAVAADASFAEAVDLTTMDGRSLRLELDSENATRFCKWWRETPAKVELRVAYRSAGGAEIVVIAATCEGHIADKPAGPLILGWDRLFVPAGESETLAELAEAGVLVGYRREAYAALAKALGL